MTKVNEGLRLTAEIRFYGYCSGCGIKLQCESIVRHPSTYNTDMVAMICRKVQDSLERAVCPRCKLGNDIKDKWEVLDDWFGAPTSQEGQPK